MEQLFGTLALLLGLAMAVIGLPGQALKNYREKKSGFSLGLILLSMGVYSSRTCYSFIVEAYYILIPDIVGFISCIVLLRQYFIYKNTKKDHLG